jgi:hypothetical protein
MKIINLFIIVLSVCFLTPLVFADEEKNNFATKGIFEYGGSISTSGVFYENGNNEYLRSKFSISFHPLLNYYIIDKIHIGLVPYITYSYYDVKVTYPNYAKHLIFLGPSFSMGYTFNLTDRLFFDISPSIEYEYGLSIYHNSDNVSYNALYYYLPLFLKYLIGNTLIGVYLAPGYHDYIGNKPPESSNYFAINLGIGITFFCPKLDSNKN